jgi:hypothetical protein
MQQVKARKGKPIIRLTAKCDDTFISAAHELVGLMKTPKNYLKFLVESVQYIGMCDYTKCDRNIQDPHIEFTNIIEHIYGAWADGGPNVIKNIADAIRRIYDWHGDTFYKSAAGFFFMYPEIIGEGGACEEDAEIHSGGLASVIMLNNLFNQRWKMEKEAQKN